MPGLSKVIVLDPDARAGRQIQLGFEREGVPAEVAAVPREAGAVELPAADAGLVVVGGADGRGLELVRRTRQALADSGADAPIVFAGRGVRRTDAEAAGADEVLLQPTYLRDVVTIGRLLRGQPAGHRAHLAGNLAETTCVLTLVRALSALGRSAVLTLVRGLRRGEVRFYHGEVTSAQVGLIHGQAALHQLLLWTDARFEFHHEDVVRRHQIPLAPDALFADAERFLAGVRESSGRLSPAMVLEQDRPRLQALLAKIPPEVHGVLQLFDGHRVLADALEDSPYRVFETLRVTQLAMDAGLLRESAGPRPKATWRAVLAIEEWLVGAESREEATARPGGDSGPAAQGAGAGKGKGKARRKKKRRANTPAPGGAGGATAAVKARADIDWGSLVPRALGAEMGPLSGVVPAEIAAGEITLPPPERLEAPTDAAQRERLLAAGAPPEPSVVWTSAQGPTSAELAAAAPPRDTVQMAAIDPVREGPAEATAGTAAEAPRDTVEMAAIEPAADPASAAATEPPRDTVQMAAIELPDAAAAPAAAEPAPDRGAAERSAAPVEVTTVASGEITAPLAAAREAAAPVEDASAEAETARLTAPREPAPREPAPPRASDELPAIIVEIDAAAPTGETIDEPSDGIIRQAIASAETARSGRRAPSPVPVDDRPGDATGEIVSITGQRAAVEPPAAEPSILIDDLAAVHSAVSAVAAAQAAAAPPASIATPAAAETVAAVADDAAAAFSEVEEAFFRAGHDGEPAARPAAGAGPDEPPADSFADLDEDYERVGFWDRLLGRRRRRGR